MSSLTRMRIGESIRETLAALERAAISELRVQASAPVPLTAIEQLTRWVVSLVDLLESDEVGGRSLFARRCGSRATSTSSCASRMTGKRSR